MPRPTLFVVDEAPHPGVQEPVDEPLTPSEENALSSPSVPALPRIRIHWLMPRPSMRYVIWRRTASKPGSPFKRMATCGSSRGAGK